MKDIELKGVEVSWEEPEGIFKAFIIINPDIGFSIKPVDPEALKKTFEKAGFTSSPWLGLDYLDPAFCFWTSHKLDECYRTELDIIKEHIINNKPLQVSAFRGNSFGFAVSCVLS